MVAIQDVRGRFKSEGDWLPFFDEAEDGYDTVEWLGAQPWSDGKVGTMGDSYAGSDQAALATLNPPHLSTMIVAVGASDYFSSSMRHNGALEQRFLIYAYRMATTSPEAKSDPALGAAILNIFENGMPEVVENFPILKDTDDPPEGSRPSSSGSSTSRRSASAQTTGSSGDMRLSNTTTNTQTSRPSTWGAGMTPTPATPPRAT